MRLSFRGQTAANAGRCLLALLVCCFAGGNVLSGACLPGWSGQVLMPAPTPGLPGWRVETDTGSSGSLLLVSNGSTTNIQLNWTIGTGDWVQARYDFAAPLDLSAADILGIALHGDSNALPNTVTVMLADAQGIFYGYDFPGQTSGINQVTRWLRNLPVPRKAFYYFWGGSGSQALDWTNITKFFLVVKRPGPGQGGGSGRLWFNPPQFDRAAAWPRQTAFVAIDTNSPIAQNSASNALHYLLGDQKPTGLLLSWTEEPSPRAWLYDQALALIALGRAGVWTNATGANGPAQAADRLAQFLIGAQKSDGHWARCWSPLSGAELVDDGWVGDQAWCVMALVDYALRSGNPGARPAATRGAAWLAALIQPDGSIRGSASTEGTADVWWAMIAVFRFADAVHIQNYLLDPARVWDADLQYWWIGGNVPLVALDCATWLSAFSRYPLVGVPERGLAALSFVRRTLLATSDDGALCGFDGLGPVSIWNEGTAQFVAAGGQDAPSFLATLLEQQNSDGSMPGSPDNWTTDAFGWLSQWRGVAPTAWLYFALTGVPFPDSARDTDGDGQPDWAEFVAGTDPLDGTSVFALRDVRVDQPSGTLRFSWSTVTNRFYTVWSAPLPTGPWTTVSGFTHVPGTGLLFEFSTGTAAPIGFFRVSVERLAVTWGPGYSGGAREWAEPGSGTERVTWGSRARTKALRKIPPMVVQTGTLLPLAMVPEMGIVVASWS